MSQSGQSSTLVLGQSLATVAVARERMTGCICRLGDEAIPLDEADGRILAEPVIAARDQPPFAASAMDGYALSSAATPGSLPVAGESSAGHGFCGRLGQGMAVRISTGAAMPEGADAIVIQEEAERTADRVIVPRAEPGDHVRPRGGDFKAGQTVLRAGRRLDALALSLAAACGTAKLRVVKRPRIAVLASGDELVPPGMPPGPYQIYESGSYAIASLIRSWGGVATRLSIASDNPAEIGQTSIESLNAHDLLVLVGGASVGDHDHARPALAKVGLKLLVEKVSVKPGKPTWFGALPQGFVLGLAGNPASAMVCCHLFLRPLLAAMQGQDPSECVRMHWAILREALSANGSREHYLRADLKVDELGSLAVRAFENQDSSLISVFSSANALIRLAPHQPQLAKGARVEVLPLDRP